MHVSIFLSGFANTADPLVFGFLTGLRPLVLAWVGLPRRSACSCYVLGFFGLVANARGTHKTWHRRRRKRSKEKLKKKLENEDQEGPEMGGK